MDSRWAGRGCAELKNWPGYDGGRRGKHCVGASQSAAESRFLIEYRLKNHLWNKNKTTLIVHVCLKYGAAAQRGVFFGRLVYLSVPRSVEVLHSAQPRSNLLVRIWNGGHRSLQPTTRGFFLSGFLFREKCETHFPIIELNMRIIGCVMSRLR